MTVSEGAKTDPEMTEECLICEGPVSTFIAYNYEIIAGKAVQTPEILRENQKAVLDAHHAALAELRAARDAFHAGQDNALVELILTKTKLAAAEKRLAKARLALEGAKP